MQHWVARLTLVAYLVGGWVLPSIHNHGSHGHGSHGHSLHGHSVHNHAACGLDAQQATDSAAESASDHHHYCGHASHACANDTKTICEPSLATLAIESHCSGHSDCQGLCAVCLARSLTTHRIVEDVPSISVLAVASTRAPSTLIREIKSFGIALSRGPPATV